MRQVVRAPARWERETDRAARSTEQKQTAGALPRDSEHRNVTVAWLPWVHRAAEKLIHCGPGAVALASRPRDEMSAILQCAVELLGERRRRQRLSVWM